MMHDTERWTEYRTRLLAFARKRVANPADAEDLVHDVLARAYAHRDALKDQASLRAWLYQIMRNAITDYYRSRRPTEELPEELPSWAREDAAARRELAGCLAPLIAGLPAPYRDAIRYAEIEGLTQRETAQRLALSHSGAKSRVQRGRAMLEAALLSCCRIALDSRGDIMEYEWKRQDGCGPELGHGAKPTGGCCTDAGVTGEVT